MVKTLFERDKDAGRNFVEEKVSLFVKLSFKNKHFQQTDTNQPSVPVLPLLVPGMVWTIIKTIS